MVELELIVCLPGLLGDHRVFEPFLTRARQHVEAVALDLPPGSPRQAAAALQLPPGRHHFVTGSFGGLVAWCLDPARIASIACVSTLPDISMCPGRIRRQTALLRALPAPLVEAMYRRHQQRSLDEDGVPPQLHLRSLDKETLVGRLQGVLDWDLPPPPDVPTLWLLGATDTQSRQTPVEVLRHRPDAQVARIPGGHRPYASHPGPMLTRLRRFWDRVDRLS